MSAGKLAVVVNANNNLGTAIVKVLCQNVNGIVYFTTTNEEEGLQAVKKLKEIGLSPKFVVAQSTDKERLKKFGVEIQKEHGGIDILINNTPNLKQDQDYPSYEEAKNVIEQYYKSLIIIEECLLPLIRDGGKVVNISNACGHHSNLKNYKWIKTLIDPDLNVKEINEIIDEYLESIKNGTLNKDWFSDNGKHADYKISMVALTALTFVWQKKYDDRNISVNAVHPGSVQNSQDADKSAEIIRYLVFEASSKIKGIFMWHNKKLIDWYDTEDDYSCEV